MNNQLPPSQIGSDLNSTIQMLFKKWKVILLFCLIGGIVSLGLVIFSPRTYQAVSIISIDSGSLQMVNIKPAFLISSDLVRQRVSEKANIEVDDLPKVKYTGNSDGTIGRITVQSSDIKEARLLANVWADVLVDWIHQSLDDINEDVLGAKIVVEEADQALLNYLEENNFGNLTWQEIALITGIGSAEEFYIILDKENLPNMTASELFRLGQLAREKYVSEWVFNKKVKLFYSDKQPLPTQVMVLNYADPLKNIVRSTHSKDKFFVAIGVLAGFFLSFTWIIVADWRKRLIEENKLNKSTKKQE